MFCSNCGQRSEGRSKNCKACGEQLQHKKAAKSKTRNVIYIIVLLLTLGGAGFGASQLFQDEPDQALKVTEERKAEQEEAKAEEPKAEEPEEEPKSEPEETEEVDEPEEIPQTEGKVTNMISSEEQSAVKMEPKKVEKTTIIKEAQQKVYTVTTETSQGSGFQFTTDGMIVTNAHVVAGFTDVMVRNINGQNQPGKVIGISEIYDVALIRVDAYQDIEPLPVEMEPTAVGTEIIALGSPSGFENTATLGYLTGIDRDFDQGFLYEDIYQIDAIIEPGSSGGPLIDAATGKVIGINSLLATDGTNFGFSIPMYSMNTLLASWAANPMTEEQVASAFEVYDEFEDYSEGNPGYEYDTHETFNEYSLSEFIGNFRYYYDMAMNNADFYYVQDLLVHDTDIYNGISDYIDDIAGKGISFNFTELEITGIEIFDTYALVHTYEAFEQTDGTNGTTLEERNKTYTVVTDEFGFYYISDIVNN